MPDVCSVKDCKKEKGHALFFVPKGVDEFARWKKVLDGHAKKPLHSKSKVCEKHFDLNSIKYFDEMPVVDGVKTYRQRVWKTLQPNSIPFIVNQSKYAQCWFKLFKCYNLVVFVTHRWGNTKPKCCHADPNY